MFCICRVWSTTSSSPKPIWVSWAWWDRWTASGSSTTTSQAAPIPTSPRTTSPCWPSWSCSPPCPTRSTPSTGCTCLSTGSAAREKPPPTLLTPPSNTVLPPPSGFIQDPVQFTGHVKTQTSSGPSNPETHPAKRSEVFARLLLLVVFLHTVNYIFYFFFLPFRMLNTKCWAWEDVAMVTPNVILFLCLRYWSSPPVDSAHTSSNLNWYYQLFNNTSTTQTSAD